MDLYGLSIKYFSDIILRSHVGTGRIIAMHITMTGNLGSGKSTICKILSEKYKFEIYSTGKVQRELAREMNMTTLELNEMMRSDHKYDNMIDDATARISRDNPDKNILFDSRLAWNFVERSFKVFVSVSLDVSAERVMNDDRGAEERYNTLEEAREMLAARAASERVRYKEIYNLNYMDFSNYNLVIDSTYCTPDEIAEMIYKEAKQYYENKQTSGMKMLVSPVRLLSKEEQALEAVEELQPIIQGYKEGTLNKVILVNEVDDNYIIVEGKDEAKAAYLAGVSYVPISVINK